MENGTFSKCSIFLTFFKSTQNFTEIFLDFFQCYLKIENDVMISKYHMEKRVKTKNSQFCNRSRKTTEVMDVLNSDV